MGLSKLMSRDLRDLSNFFVTMGFVLFMSALPEVAAASGGAGGFMGQTSTFEADVRKFWTLFSYVAIFLGLAVMVGGMFLPIASWMKWGAVGAILVGAFGESVVTYLYDVGGNENETLQQSRGS